MCIFFYINILIFERSKGTERKKKKIGRNKVDSGPFSALSPCANETLLSDLGIIVTSSFSETNGAFVFHSAKVP